MWPRRKPGWANSMLPSERLPSRASQRVSGPRGATGSAVCAKTAGTLSTDRTTSRTQASRPRDKPRTAHSSLVGMASFCVSRCTENAPRHCRRAVNEPRSSSQRRRQRKSPRQGKRLCHDMRACRLIVYCGRGACSMPPIRVPTAIPLAENHDAFISSAKRAADAAQ